MLKLYSTLRDDQVKHHRKLDCPHYIYCLSEAVRLGWKSFSCALCEGKPTEPLALPTPIQMRLLRKALPSKNLRQLVSSGKLDQASLQRALPLVDVRHVLPLIVGKSVVQIGRQALRRKLGLGKYEHLKEEQEL